MNRRKRWHAPVALITNAAFFLGSVPRFAQADEATAYEPAPPAEAPRPSATADNRSSEESKAPAADIVHTAAAPSPAKAPSEAEISRVAQPPGADTLHAGSDGSGSSAPIVASLAVGGDKTGVSSQAISVPQGTGKIQGMGESFSTQMSTGVATFSVPFSLPDARGGSQPSLTLAYSSGDGHGIAGVGWGIGWPYISRQTDRGLPSYDDETAWQPRQDRFVFNGGQELVPICTVTGGSCSGALSGEAMPAWADGWQYFRSRVEGSYLRFFWSQDHKTWRVQSKSGESMELGAPLDGSGDTSAIESDPAAPAHIFRWNLARQYDNEGSPPPAGAAAPAPVNVVVYRYTSSGNMAYLSDVYDTPPASSPTSAPLSAYAHHTRLLYQTRPDATSSYRRGWRTDSLLRLTGVDVTSAAFLAGPTRHDVRRYHLTYDPSYHVSLLTSVQLEGRCATDEASAPAEDSNGALPAVTGCDTLPAMTFGYQHVTPYNVDGSPGSADLAGYEGFDERIIRMSGSPPNSIDEDLTDLFDINGDSLPDVVNTLPGSNGRYPMFVNGGAGARNAFTTSSLGLVGALGATANDIQLSNENLAVLDMNGDGIINWVHQPAVGSYAVYTPTLLPSGWSMVGQAVTNAANQSPHLDFGDDTPDINVLDVNGDGLVDVVRTTGTEMQTFFALGRYPSGDGNFGSATWTGPNSAALSLQAVTSCVPLVSTGVPIRFSDSTTMLGDMNGDGLQDIVFVQPGNLMYWPGRGDGSWGTGGPCVNGFAPNTSIAMATPPQYSDPDGVGLRIDDVNGDGLDDLVDVQFDNVQVWLNVDGSGWTAQPHIISGVTPASGPLWVNKVRLVDVGGTGTRDILWGEGGAYRYIDLQGGERPWVLTHIANGLGKTTDIQYEPATTQMLAAEAAGNPWASVSPIPLQVVQQTTERDNLTVAGYGPTSYVTQYTYRDPVYDGRQREFRGFRSAIGRRIGDANSPSSSSSSEFLLGDCADDEPPPAPATSRCTPDGRWTDNVREALKGLPVVSESYDDNGVYLSTAHHQYTLRKLYTGVDGREVRVAFESATDSWGYDTAPFTAVASSPVVADIVLDQVAGPEPSTPAPLKVRATAGTAHTQSSSVVDLFGNATSSVAKGCVDGAACPTPDDVITSRTVPELVSGDASGWLWRTVETNVQDPSDPAPRKDTFTDYDVNGNPIHSYATLSGTLPLDRFHEIPSASIAPTPPPLASADGTIDLSWQTYDAFGNVTWSAAPNNRCRQVTYASDFGDVATSESTFVGAATGSCGAGPGGAGGTSLTAYAGYDRGLSAAVSTIDLHGELTRVAFDDLGRLTTMWKPSPTQIGATSPQPSVLIDYDLATSSRPYSIVHTKTQDGADDTVASYREAFGFVDGFGRPILGFEQADPTAGDAAPWILGGLTVRDGKGATQYAYLASFWSGSDPRTYPIAQPATTGSERQRYDAFGRQVQTFALDGTVILQSAYHALSVDKWDAADLAPGPHQGTYASAAQDGHGRAVSMTERIHAGAQLEARTTTTQFMSTGEPRVITRQRGTDQVVRWLQYDSLGRMVLNVEPNTTKNFIAPPAPGVAATIPPTTKAWRYAYDVNGELVGTSDARGCGSNYAYDAGGRVTIEDYSPCLAAQALYSAPNPSTGDGAEVFYHYDSADSTAPTTIDDCTINASLMLGRLASVSDRASKTLSSFDGRGRAMCGARQIAVPVAPGTSIDLLASRYAPTWYTQTTSFDGADRPIQDSTGAKVVVPASGQSYVSTSYSKRGTVATVGSSYGPLLVTSVVRDADGSILQIGHGDAAGTTSSMTYDVRRRLSTAQTYRGAPSLWSEQPAAYSPAPNPNGPPTTLQRLLADSDFHYDAVDNPIEIDDWRDPSEWPVGAQPVTRKMQYDDLYRLSQISYQYATGADAWTDPFAAEDTGSPSELDPRRAAPSPHLSFTNRVLSQTFQYDWLGNTTQTGDDAGGFYDRSLGEITNGTPSAGPYQLQSAAGGAAPRDGSLTTTYDAAGNLQGLSIERNTAAPCLPTSAPCSQFFAYDWDEVGRLVRARRWDGNNLGVASGPLPAAATAVDLQYAYDGNDDRVVKTAVDSSGNALFTVYIADSLELRRTTFEAGDYVRDVWTEVPYLFAHGERLARVHYATDDVPTLTSGNLHVLLEVQDFLGSTAIVLDQATGELVEDGTYEAYGATESDYRPERWDSYREDYRFTGKEEDVEVGLQYFGKRYYAPGLGRWVSADPLAVHGLGADANVYAYVHGRALRAVDPVGLEEGHIEETAEKAGGVSDAPPAATPSGPPHPNCHSSTPAPTMTSLARGGEGMTRDQMAQFIEDHPAQPDPGPEMQRKLQMFEVNTGFSGTGMMKGEFPNTFIGLQAQLQHDARPVTDKLPILGGVNMMGDGLAEGTDGHPVVGGVKVLVGAARVAADVGGISSLARSAAAQGISPGRLVMTGLCFVAGTLVDTPDGQEPIEALAVGDRVRTTDDDGSGSTNIDSATWRDVRLRMPNPDGSDDVLDVEILRPERWLAEVGAVVGQWIFFGLPEMGLFGPAEVETISATPKIHEGPGRVVRATVTHLNSEVRILQFRDARDVLEPTARHRLYSVDRHDWVQAEHLKVGEHLRAEGGVVTIASNVEKIGTERVYDIEVETEHSYLVGASRVLSHNVNPCAAEAVPGAYSVAFEARLTEQGIGTYGSHFAEANEQLLKAMGDPETANALKATLGENFEGSIVSPSGSVRGVSPEGWTWHHVGDQPGVLQLVPDFQHAPGSAWQPLLHPGGVGGMSIWGSLY